MPSVKNNLITGVLERIYQMFRPTAFETGSIEVFPHTKTVKINSGKDAAKVFLSISSVGGDIYNEKFGKNFVSEVAILPDGFIFEVKVHSRCVVTWFVLECEK